MDREEVKEVFGNEDVKETADHTADESVEDKEEDSEHESVSSEDSKKQSKEKMYTQAQVDAMMAKTRKKYAKTGIKEEEPKNDVPAEAEEQRDLSTGITVEKLAQAELKAEMAIQGIIPQKVARAVRLIDVADVIDENGQYSEKMAQTAIEELLKDWPELKQSSHESNSFEFGAPEQQEQDLKQNQKSAISKIFGN